MANANDNREHLASETRRRERLAVPAAAGGILFLLSAIVNNAVVRGVPSVGLLQGLEPALGGNAHPPVSARAPEVRYFSHQGFSLIATSVLDAIAVVLLMVVLLFLLEAARFRRTETSPVAGPLVIAGGAGVAVFGIGKAVTIAIRAHEFAFSSDHSEHAVEQALSKGAANVLFGYVDLLAPLVLMVGMIMVLLAATRAGLIQRWMRTLGIATAIVILPLFSTVFILQIISTAWLVAVGFMFRGNLPGGDPPAWAAGEARPWPSAAAARAERPSKGALTPAPAAADAGAPAPTAPAGGSSRRRRRKRRG